MKLATTFIKKTKYTKAIQIIGIDRRRKCNRTYMNSEMKLKRQNHLIKIIKAPGDNTRNLGHVFK